jgi:hypothetical protein
MIGLVLTIAFLIFAIWIIIIFFKFAVILFLIFLIMACFKVGSILAYVVIACAGVMLYGIMYSAFWGNE